MSPIDDSIGICLKMHGYYRAKSPGGSPAYNRNRGSVGFPTGPIIGAFIAGISWFVTRYD